MKILNGTMLNETTLNDEINPVSRKKRLMPKQVKQALIVGSSLKAFFYLIVFTLSYAISGGM
ncbi:MULTISPECIES: hypothetical protein [Bacillus cereus group]|uniref:hypothetical protein n=1 Tax=Bacillus cereus group TaxID=86661 RepID=UPI001BAB89E3|nr:hypothetical protein [Bacillus cereus]MBR9655788.1 hypothetical protein [Bacillus cereus]